MTDSRIATTAQTARRLGMKRGAFLRMRRENADFPKPIHGKRHHLWWDYKAIEQFIDKLSGLTKESSETDWNKVFEEDSHGERQGGLSH